MNKTTKEMDSLGKETEETGESAKKASKDGFTVFKAVLADLLSKTISKLLEGLKKIRRSYSKCGKNGCTKFCNL